MHNSMKENFFRVLCRVNRIMCLRHKLPYHYDFAGGVVADFDEVGTAGGDVETQGHVLVALGGEDAAGDIVEGHLVAVGTFHYQLALA